MEKNDEVAKAVGEYLDRTGVNYQSRKLMSNNALRLILPAHLTRFAWNKYVGNMIGKEQTMYRNEVFWGPRTHKKTLRTTSATLETRIV